MSGRFNLNLKFNEFNMKNDVKKWGKRRRKNSIEFAITTVWRSCACLIFFIHWSSRVLDVSVSRVPHSTHSFFSLSLLFLHRHRILTGGVFDTRVSYVCTILFMLENNWLHPAHEQRIHKLLIPFSISFLFFPSCVSVPCLTGFFYFHLIFCCVASQELMGVSAYDTLS